MMSVSPCASQRRAGFSTRTYQDTRMIEKESILVCVLPLILAAVGMTVYTFFQL